MAWFESQRRQMVNVVSALSDEQLKIRRVHSWLDGVVLEHLKEHSVEAPRFLIIDMLRREWGDYVASFPSADPGEAGGILEEAGVCAFSGSCSARPRLVGKWNRCN